MFSRRMVLQLFAIVTAPLPPPLLCAVPPTADESQRPVTKLERYLQSRGIKPAHLARESGYSREDLLRVRMGRIAATAGCKRAVVSALRRLAGEPLAVADVFDHRASRA